MKVKKIWMLTKATGEGFSLGAGSAGIVFTIISSFLSVPLLVTFPLIGGVGIIFAVAGGYYGFKKFNEKEKSRKHQVDSLLAHEIKHDFHKIKKTLAKQSHLAKASTSTATIFNVTPQMLDVASQTSNNDIEKCDQLKKLNLNMSDDCFQRQKINPEDSKHQRRMSI